ncbi:TonB-dependent receptor [Sphingobium chlorophenolicum L-1]|uniref:TonB-dependent receptor n=1 Tax=Sphingobium chlorophenolicum L-1 TaxID=690566 RepID=F6F322_SPHCR|nr:TonB-dependent receptor [Sphingobium chlorophenolicum]AEG50834.1 TonB-dependent receptor [Sphingobium chlorophenolicum L-1]
MKKSLALLYAGSAVFSASPAMAQDTAASAEPTASVEQGGSNAGLTDIIVTARKRSESVQNIPLAVTAISTARLEETRITNVAQLGQLVPSFNVIKNAANPGALFGFLRGFGSKSSDPSSEPAISLNIDEIYQANTSGSVVNLFDVEAVEVLRGPQGTLLGKNSPAGGISVRTRRPGDVFGGMAQIDYGSFNDLQLRSYVDVPVAKDLSTTFSYFRDKNDGYIKNIRNGRKYGAINVQSFRAAFLATPGDLSWYVTAQYDINRSGTTPGRNLLRNDVNTFRVPGADYSVSPLTAPTACTRPATAAVCTDPLPGYGETDVNFGSPRDDRTWSITSNLSFDAGPINLAVASGYRDYQERNTTTDNDHSAYTVLESLYQFKANQFSNEIRVASSDGGGLDLDGKLNWLVGAFYLHAAYPYRLVANRSLGSLTYSPTYQTGITDSYAVFGHAELEVLPGLSVSAGARQTWDKKTHTYRNATMVANNQPAMVESGSWANFSIDGTVEYRFEPGKMVYVRYAEGYRGGGFVGVPASAANAGSFQPETVKSYEAGTKVDFWGHRARLNVTGFINKFSDLQRTISEPTTAAPFFVQVPRNIASATTQGVEVEAELRPIPELTLRGSLGYLDAKYDRFIADLSGTRPVNGVSNPAVNNTSLRFPYTSKWTYSLGGSYDADLGSAGKLTISADWNYRSSFNMTDLNFAFAEQKGYGLLSANVTWTDPSDRYSVSVYSANLTNKRYAFASDGSGGLTAYVVDGAPRSVGVSGKVKF